jgi:hypothetical protein
MKIRDSWFVIRGSLIGLLWLTACQEIPATAYYNRGDPENLVDVSSEIVTMPLANRAHLKELAGMIANDPPTRAQLNCALSDSLCMQAKETLQQQGVPTQFDDSIDGGIALVYERVVSRDCENSYVDNGNDKYALNAPAFGCSLMSNTVQMVSDKRQFASPRLMDFHDAEKAAQAYQRYLLPPPPKTGANSENDSLLDKSSSQSGGQ